MTRSSLLLVTSGSDSFTNALTDKTTLEFGRRPEATAEVVLVTTYVLDMLFASTKKKYSLKSSV